MTIKRFEDLDIWNEAREISKKIFLITSIEPFSSDYKFKNQIRSAAGSIMDNIAEGFGRGGNKEFINFLSISKGSVDEVRSQLYRAFDFEYINQNTLEEMLKITFIQTKKTTNFISYLKKSDRKGSKFEL